MSTFSFYAYKNTLNFKIISSSKLLSSVLKMTLLKRHKYITIAMKNQKNINKRIISSRLMNCSFKIII